MKTWLLKFWIVRWMVVMVVMAFCLALVTQQAKADGQLWLTVNGLAYHTDRTKEHNETNSGFGLEYSWENSAVLAGQYENSYWMTSRYVAYRYTPWRAGPFKLGGFAGLMDGYDEGKISPSAGAVVTLDTKPIGVNLIAVPYYRGLVFGLQFKLGWR